MLSVLSCHPSIKSGDDIPRRYPPPLSIAGFYSNGYVDIYIHDVFYLEFTWRFYTILMIGADTNGRREVRWIWSDSNVFLSIAYTRFLCINKYLELFSWMNEWLPNTGPFLCTAAPNPRRTQIDIVNISEFSLLTGLVRYVQIQTQISVHPEPRINWLSFAHVLSILYQSHSPDIQAARLHRRSLSFAQQQCPTRPVFPVWY